MGIGSLPSFSKPLMSSFSQVVLHFGHICHCQGMPSWVIVWVEVVVFVKSRLCIIYWVLPPNALSAHSYSLEDPYKSVNLVGYFRWKTFQNDWKSDKYNFFYRRMVRLLLSANKIKLKVQSYCDIFRQNGGRTSKKLFLHIGQTWPKTSGKWSCRKKSSKLL